MQKNVKSWVFLKLDSRYAEYFPEYSSDFGRSLRLLKYMYVMTNYGKLFSDELIEWLIEAGFIQYKCQMSIYYKYAPGGKKLLLYPMLIICVYWYTSGAIEKLVFGLYRRDITCELPGICTLMYVNQDLTDEGPFHLSISG